MKFNIANPSTGCQKKLEIDYDKLRAFYDKRLSQEVSGDALSEEFKGYVFKIMSGCDKQGFPMKQKGVLISSQDNGSVEYVSGECSTPKTDITKTK